MRQKAIRFDYLFKKLKNLIISFDEVEELLELFDSIMEDLIFTEIKGVKGHEIWVPFEGWFEATQEMQKEFDEAYLRWVKLT